MHFRGGLSLCDDRDLVENEGCNRVSPGELEAGTLRLHGQNHGTTRRSKSVICSSGALNQKSQAFC